MPKKNTLSERDGQMNGLYFQKLLKIKKTKRTFVLFENKNQPK